MRWIIGNLLLLLLSALAQVGCRAAPVLAASDGRRLAPAPPAALDPMPRGGDCSVQQASSEPSFDTVSGSSDTTGPGESNLELTLFDAIGMALESNPDVRCAVARIRIADATLARARADLFPQLAVSESYAISNNPVNAFSYLLNQTRLDPRADFNDPDTTDNFHTQLTLQQGIYAGGRRGAQVNAGRAGCDAAAFNLETVRNELSYRVAEAYYRLLQARELVSVRSEAVQQVEQHLEAVQTRYRAETAVKSDVLTVEVRLAEVREALISGKNQVELGWAVLESVIGRRIEQRSLPKGIPAAPWSEHVAELESAVAEAMERRSAVGESASLQRAAAHDLDVARAAKRPSVDLVADYDLFTGDFARGNDSFFAGLAVRLNLFDSGRTASELARAHARLRELEARHERLLLDIELDVRRAFLQLQDARERQKVATQAIAQAEESLREIEVRYRGQTATIRQLIDAQVALSAARVRRANAAAEVAVSHAALERATGRLTHAIPQDR
jgi:outer membrane protein TolC